MSVTEPIDEYFDSLAVYAKHTAEEIFDRIQEIVQKDCVSAREHVSRAVMFGDEVGATAFTVMT